MNIFILIFLFTISYNNYAMERFSFEDFNDLSNQADLSLLVDFSENETQSLQNLFETSQILKNLYGKLDTISKEWQKVESPETLWIPGKNQIHDYMMLLRNYPQNKLSDEQKELLLKVGVKLKDEKALSEWVIELKKENTEKFNLLCNACGELSISPLATVLYAQTNHRTNKYYYNQS